MTKIVATILHSSAITETVLGGLVAYTLLEIICAV